MTYTFNNAQITIGEPWNWLIIVLVIWTLVWKGWAMWRAAQNNSKPWFILLLILNTAGVLDIFYLLFAGKPNQKKTD